MKHKKRLKKAIQEVLILSGLLLSFSCGNLFEHKASDSDNNSNGKTYLAIKAGTTKTGRTITPNLSLETLHNFTLKGTREGVEELNKTAANIGDFEEQYEIIPGEWTFILSAESSDGASMGFSATVTTEIKRGIVNQLYFELKPNGTEGDFAITINLSNNNRIDKAIATLKNLSGETLESKTYNITSEQTSISYTKTDFTSGTYDLLFEFFAGNNPTPVNQWESYLCVVPQVSTTATVSLILNEVHFITYNNIDNANLISGTVIETYSVRSEFDLPLYEKNGQIFLGWKDADGNYISKIDSSCNSDLVLTADFKNPALYVSADGNDTTDSPDKGFVSTKPFKTIEGACKKIKQLCKSELDWTIYINGEITGTPTGSGNYPTYGPITISNEENEEYGLSPSHAKSLTLTGMNGLDTDGSILAGTEDASHNIIEPVDILNRGSTGAYNNSYTSTVLTINTTVPVTITNLKITGGNTTNGGGVFIKEGATVSIGDGVLITKNRSTRGGAIFNQGTLFIYGTAILGNINATNYAGYSSTQNLADEVSANYAGSGGGIYNGDISSTVGNTKIIAKLYLGYKLSDDRITPVKEDLKGGIYYCGAGKGGGICNAPKSLVYFDSGTIMYNGVSGDGGGIYNNTAGRLEMTGGQIVKNSASYIYSVMNGGGVCNDYLDSIFIMSGGVINENRAWCTTSGSSDGKGGGVFNGGKMFMYGTAIIGNSEANTFATEDSCGNKANQGGGIYNEYSTDRRGYLYIGYEPDTDGSTPKEAAFTGGIYNNYSKLNSNVDSKYGGGAIYSSAFPPNYGIVKIAKGTIAYNATENYGGAYCGKYITITGGSILNNSAAKKGGAIYLNDNTESVLSLGGNVQIPFTGTEQTGYQNDICTSVYSKTYFTKIKLLSTLTNHSASNQLRVTPENYHEGIQLITIDSTAETDYETEIPKFIITPEIHTEYNTRADWEFDNSGKLHSTIPFADISVALSSPDIKVSATYNNGYTAGSGTIQGTRNVVFTADPGYTYTWMLDDDIITNTESSEDAVAILSNRNDGINNVLTINTLKLIHGGVYDVYLEAEKDGIKYSYMAQMKIQNY